MAITKQPPSTSTTNGSRVELICNSTALSLQHSLSSKRRQECDDHIKIALLLLEKLRDEVLSRA